MLPHYYWLIICLFTTIEKITVKNFLVVVKIDKNSGPKQLIVQNINIYPVVPRTVNINNYFIMIGLVKQKIYNPSIYPDEKA